MSESLGHFVVIEHANDAFAVVTPEMQAPVRGRIAIQVESDMPEGRLATLVLRAVGKRRDPKTSPRRSWTIKQAARWLEACSINEMFVGPAERLSPRDLKNLETLSTGRRLWLIYAGPCSNTGELEESFGPAATATQHQLLTRVRPHSHDASEELEDIPPLPLVDELRFLGACQRELSLLDFERVKSVTTKSAHHVFDWFPRIEDPGQLLRTSLLATTPVWGSLAMLRGAQLGVMARGYRLRLDIDKWLVVRGGLPHLGERTLSGMRGAIDPRPSALIAAYCSVGGDPRVIRDIRVADVGAGARTLKINSTCVAISEELRPFLRAHISALGSSHLDADVRPLFPNPSDELQTPNSLRAELRNALVRFGLPGATSPGALGASYLRDDSLETALRAEISPLRTS